MTALAEALEGGNAQVVRERVGSLVEKVRLVPVDGSFRIEIRGEMSTILGLSSAAKG